MENNTNKQDLNNLRKLARNSFSSENYVEASKYFELVLKQVPNDWEATLYKEFYTGILSPIHDVDNSSQRLYDAIADALVEIAESTNSIVDFTGALLFINLAVVRFTSQKIDEAEKEFDIYNDVQKYVDRVFECYSLEYNTGDLVEALGERYAEFAVNFWESGIDSHHLVFSFFDDKNTNYRIMKEYAEKIQKYNPSYKLEKPSSGGGCYIATAVYGSYDCPEVWTLRRYRDNILAKTIYGRIFIFMYYTVSPTLVKWFGKTKWFKCIFKAKLDKMVLNLNKKGIKDTPYNDQNWQ